MQRRPAKSQWADVIWEPHGVVPNQDGAGKKLLVERDGVAQWLHSGLELELHRDEAEGYYLNLTAPDPRVFILWRMEGEEGLPIYVTVSSEEAGRWLDGGGVGGPGSDHGRRHRGWLDHHRAHQY